MIKRILAAVFVVIVLLAAPTIARGITDFKTFLALTSLLNHCNGAGSPGCQP